MCLANNTAGLQQSVHDHSSDLTDCWWRLMPRTNTLSGVILLGPALANPDPSQSLHLWPQLGLQQMKYNVMVCSPVVGACEFNVSALHVTEQKSSATMYQHTCNGTKIKCSNDRMSWWRIPKPPPTGNDASKETKILWDTGLVPSGQVDSSCHCTQ